MDPDVAAAVAHLERAGTLSSEQARLFGRVARRELVSVRAQLRLLAYAGVLLAAAGVAELVRENLDRIGPLAIASALACGAAGCLAWVARRAPAFSRGESASPDLALDYVLLLGALLAAAALAFVEARFTPLGPAWTWHLLLVCGLYAALAFRYDSRVVFTLALSSFAAWRGVSSARLQGAFWLPTDDLVRANAAGCALAFLALGAALRARSLKPHFEPVAAHLGWLLLLGTAASGLGGAAGRPWALVLIALAAVAGFVGHRQQRFSLMAIGLVAAYVGVSALAVRALQRDGLVFWWFSLTPLAVVVLLFAAHRSLKEPE
jgi:hypothetical protein